MDIILPDGEVLINKSPANFVTGYKAKGIIMGKGDFERLRQFAKSNPEQFDVAMKQLDARFNDVRTK